MNGLIGSEQYEHFEENLMVGFRGCGRYIDPFFEECFLQSLELMIPFVHTWDMAKDANELLEPNGLKHGEDGLKVNMMAVLRSCVFVAEEQVVCSCVFLHTLCT